MHSSAADRRKDSTAPEVVIRFVRTSDSGDLFSFYGGLSAESLHARSLGYTRGLSGPVARSLCTLDHMRDEGFVARATEHGEDRILGHVCLARVGPRQLELGYYAANGRVLALLASAPFGARVAPADAGVVDVTIPLEASGARNRIRTRDNLLGSGGIAPRGRATPESSEQCRPANRGFSRLHAQRRPRRTDPVHPSARTGHPLRPGPSSGTARLSTMLVCGRPDRSLDGNTGTATSRMDAR